MAEEHKDWYKILGIERSATNKDIIKAYRVQALKFHPDKNPDDPHAASAFHDVNTAYELLKDPAARLAFDNFVQVKVTAKARTDHFDATRKKMKEDLEAREAAFRKQQQDEKQAAVRLHYEMERLKKESIAKRAEKEAEAKILADQIRHVADAARNQRQSKQENEQEDADPLDSTVRLKWKKKKHTFEVDEIKKLFAKFGPIDSCLSKNPGSAIVAFHSVPAAYAAIKAATPENGKSKDLSIEAFEVSWAGGKEPASVASLRAMETSLDSDDKQPTLSFKSTTSVSSPSSSLSSASSPSKLAPLPDVYTPGFKPAFGSAATFASTSSSATSPFSFSSAPSFRAPPIFNTAPPMVARTDDYEADTLARMVAKDKERKRLLEQERQERDKEEEENKKQKTS